MSGSSRLRGSRDGGRPPHVFAEASVTFVCKREAGHAPRPEAFPALRKEGEEPDG